MLYVNCSLFVVCGLSLVVCCWWLLFAVCCSYVVACCLQSVGVAGNVLFVVVRCLVLFVVSCLMLCVVRVERCSLFVVCC